MVSTRPPIGLPAVLVEPGEHVAYVAYTQPHAYLLTAAERWVRYLWVASVGAWVADDYCSSLPAVARIWLNTY